MQKRGDIIRNRGMRYTVTDIQFSPDSVIPYVILTRDFDRAKFYAKTNRVNHWTVLHRIPDTADANLDSIDVMTTLDQSYRRI